jgi:hypothetical protein
MAQYADRRAQMRQRLPFLQDMPGCRRSGPSHQTVERRSQSGKKESEKEKERGSRQCKKETFLEALGAVNRHGGHGQGGDNKRRCADGALG